MGKFFAGAIDPVHPEATGAVEGLKCAELGCDGDLRLRWSWRLSRYFYGCSEWPGCNGILPANQDGSPHGSPRTRKLQGARRRAHLVFDQLWKTKLYSRSKAYRWLSRRLGMPKRKVHMELFNEEQCERVIKVVIDSFPWTAKVLAKEASFGE